MVVWPRRERPSLSRPIIMERATGGGHVAGWRAHHRGVEVHHDDADATAPTRSARDDVALATARNIRIALMAGFSGVERIRPNSNATTNHAVTATAL